MRATHGRALRLALIVGLLLAAGTRAQEGSTRDLPFTDVIEVQLVNVEVWVTDGHGNPVRGLTADDFEILEDGQPVQITNFAEVQEDRPVAPSRQQAAEKAVAGETPPAPTTPVVEPGHLVVYFDELHLLPASRRQAIHDIEEFLATDVVPPDRVLILSQGESLSTEASFGSTWRELDETLGRLEKRQPQGGAAASEKRLAIRNVQDLWQWALSVAQGDNPDAACEVFLPRAIPDIETYAAQARERIAVTLEHLASVASFLTGVPGVKTLLFVSDALERAPGADLVKLVNDLCPVQQQTPMFLLSDELSQEFRRLTRHANANRVTIYALQTEGLTTGFMGAAEQEGNRGFRGSVAFDLAKRVSEREGMSTLAAETGGRAIFNRNEFGDELVAISQEMSSYYSLAYEPPHNGDEREHEIDVRLKNKELQARYRKGYRDKSADVQMTERLQGAVYLGLVDNPLGVRLGAGTLVPAAKGRLDIPLHVLVPAKNITFLPNENGVVAQLSVQVSTRNTVDQKGVFDHRAYRINWHTPTDQELVALKIDLEVPPGVHLVAVGVRDDATLVTSFVSTTIEVHPEEATPAGGR
jgi:VWFA-related protein